MATMVLCRCACHAACPLAGEPTTAQAVWDERCACPGADRAREVFARSAARRRELNRIAGDVDMAGHPDAEEIEIRLRAVFEEHGQAPPAAMTSWSRLSGTHAGYRAAAVVATVATGLTAAAVLSTGWRRVALGAVAGAAWLASGYAITAVTAIGQLTRWTEAHPRAQDLPSR
jgi:hypothetical protein